MVEVGGGGGKWRWRQVAVAAGGGGGRWRWWKVAVVETVRQQDFANRPIGGVFF